jgi:hypothetical protein
MLRKRRSLPPGGRGNGPPQRRLAPRTLVAPDTKREGVGGKESGRGRVRSWPGSLPLHVDRLMRHRTGETGRRWRAQRSRERSPSSGKSRVYRPQRPTVCTSRRWRMRAGKWGGGTAAAGREDLAQDPRGLRGISRRIAAGGGRVYGSCFADGNTSRHCSNACLRSCKKTSIAWVRTGAPED